MLIPARVTPRALQATGGWKLKELRAVETGHWSGCARSALAPILAPPRELCVPEATEPKSLCPVLAPQASPTPPGDTEPGQLLKA